MLQRPSALNGLLLCCLLFLSLNLQAKSSFDVDVDSLLCGDEPNVAISLLDVWAGVFSFAECISKQLIVTVTKHAWIECGPAAALLFEEFYPTELCAYDFYDETWKHWKFLLQYQRHLHRSADLSTQCVVARVQCSVHSQ